MNQQNIDYVLRSVEQRDIRFVRLWFVDILGRLKNFAISPEDLEVAFEEGIGFDGSAIEGFATPEEADMLAFPDASTFQILPWRPSHNGVARVFCPVRRSSTALRTVTAITSGISLVSCSTAAMAIAPNATWESPSPMKEKRFSTSVTPSSDEHRAISTPTTNAYRTNGYAQ